MIRSAPRRLQTSLGCGPNNTVLVPTRSIPIWFTPLKVLGAAKTGEGTRSGYSIQGSSTLSRTPLRTMSNVPVLGSISVLPTRSQLPDDPNRLNRAPQYSELNSSCLGGAFTTRCVGTNSVSAEAKRNNVFALQLFRFAAIDVLPWGPESLYANVIDVFSCSFDHLAFDQ